MKVKKTERLIGDKRKISYTWNTNSKIFLNCIQFLINLVVCWFLPVRIILIKKKKKNEGYLEVIPVYTLQQKRWNVIFLLLFKFLYLSQGCALSSEGIVTEHKRDEIVYLCAVTVRSWEPESPSFRLLHISQFNIKFRSS